jgi:hypothetical protein
MLQMEVPYTESLHLARKAKSANGKVIWNLAPVPDQMTGAMSRDLLDATDYLVVNEHEALVLDAGVTDFEAACSWLAKSGGLTCVVTAGAHRALAVTADDTRFRAPSPSIRPVDTTGAGDTFVGAFASMIDEKSSVKRALELGCEAAALSCLKAGAQHGTPMSKAMREVARPTGLASSTVRATRAPITLIWYVIVPAPLQFVFAGLRVSTSSVCSDHRLRTDRRKCRACNWALRSIGCSSRSGIRHRRRRRASRANLGRRQGTRHSLQWEDRWRLTGQCLWMRIDASHGCTEI